MNNVRSSFNFSLPLQVFFCWGFVKRYKQTSANLTIVSVFSIIHNTETINCDDGNTCCSSQFTTPSSIPELYFHWHVRFCFKLIFSVNVHCYISIHLHAMSVLSLDLQKSFQSICLFIMTQMWGCEVDISDIFSPLRMHLTHVGHQVSGALISQIYQHAVLCVDQIKAKSHKLPAFINCFKKVTADLCTIL